MSRQLLVSGGRNYSLSSAGIILLNNLQDKYKFTINLNGGAKGIDQSVREFCEKVNINVKIFYPDWKGLGKKAGPIRNGLMVRELKPGDVALFFMGGLGTNSCYELARNSPASIIDLRSHLDLIK